MAPTEAAEIASHLAVEMPEADAKGYLEHRGLKCSMSALGTSVQWSDIFPLTNRFALALEIDAKQVGAVGTGVLRGSNIQSNGIIIRSVTLSNAPL